jgi:hypothetical protein
MHTRTIKHGTIVIYVHHNSDWSGDVIINADHLGSVRVPGCTLIDGGLIDTGSLPVDVVRRITAVLARDHALDQVRAAVDSLPSLKL